jgi:hypothetical protein
VTKALGIGLCLALALACAATKPLALDQASPQKDSECAPIVCVGETCPSPLPKICVQEVERPWYRFGNASRITLTDLGQTQCVRVVQDDARQFADHDLGYDDDVSRLNRRELELEPESNRIRFLVAASSRDATKAQALANVVRGTGSPLEIRLFTRPCSALCVGSTPGTTLRFVPNAEKPQVDANTEGYDCSLVGQRASNRVSPVPPVPSASAARSAPVASSRATSALPGSTP